MSNETHTPTPWKQRIMGSEGARIFPHTGVLREDMKFIAMVNGRDFHTDEANAEFIVLACNSHDALLSALKAMRAANKEHYSAMDGSLTPRYQKPQCDEIRSANKHCDDVIAIVEGPR